MVSHDIIDMVTLKGRGFYKQRIKDYLSVNPNFTNEDNEKIMKIINGLSLALPNEKIEKLIVKECEKDSKNSTLVFLNILNSIRPSLKGKLLNINICQIYFYYYS
ncbi:hypothetical protein ACTFIZ_003130 [Dictyostelium cf. discoideum]